MARVDTKGLKPTDLRNAKIPASHAPLPLKVDNHDGEASDAHQLIVVIANVDLPDVYRPPHTDRRAARVYPATAHAPQVTTVEFNADGALCSAIDQ